MRNRFLNYAAVCLLLLFFSACSTQKNTWSSRNYNDLTTRYNVYFNGNEAYKSGIKQLKNSHKEDYSKLLPMYMVSNHENAKSTASSMTRSIEKCEKAIKKHSIRVKPKEKPTSKSSAAKKLFYSKEEFNPFMDNVFLMMANAQFHKADFLSANSTCSYITRHFSTDKVTCDKANILMARANTEMEWYYEAENIFDKLNKENLTPSLTGSFSAAYADLLIRQKKWTEAIPYLEIAIKRTRNKSEKYRWNFLLAQIYQETGKNDLAYKLFNAIPGMNPPYEMELGARIRQTEVYPGSDTRKPLRKLRMMSRSSKNTDYLDQVFYAMGNLYFAAGDTVKAVESFVTALEKSTQNGPHKLKTELALGNYYYKTEQFIKAEPCYTDALAMLKKEDERYLSTNQRAVILQALAPNLDTVHDEDSLQLIAKMPEKERDIIIAKLVEAAEKAAREEERKKSMEEALAANEESMGDNTAGNQNEATPNMPNLNIDKNWYFYNTTNVSKGLVEFRRKWGKRSLKDDWRRNNKTAVFDNMPNAEGSEQLTDAIQTKDTANVASTDSTELESVDYNEGAEDPLNPNFYLKNLPFTEEQLTASNEKIAEALFNAGVVYREQMENDRLALKTFQELESRNPNSPFLENAYYIAYLMLKQQKKNGDAEVIRQKQITLFPDGMLAKRLDDSLFVDKLIEMYQVQDTLYGNTYKSYLSHQTDSIFTIGRYVEENYPVSPLIPKFIFLQAMESARIGKPTDYYDLLNKLVKDYPKSDLIPVVNQMLAFWNEGRRPVASSGFTNLLDANLSLEKDSLSMLDSLAQKFAYNPAEAHVLLIQYPTTVNVNRLQFDVALYNFTNFLIRDYELSFVKVGKMDVLLISGFENAEDVLRYRSWIVFQGEKPEIKYPGIQLILVSESNLKLLQEDVPPEKYLDFFEKNYSGNQTNP